MTTPGGATIHRIVSAETGLNFIETSLNGVHLKDDCGICYEPRTRLFRLTTNNTLYAFRITPRTNQIEHLYWGTRLTGDADLSFLSLNSVLMKSPFDPTSQAVIGGPQSSDVNSLRPVGEESGASSMRRTETSADLHRQENIHWRQWGLDRQTSLQVPEEQSSSPGNRLLSPRSSSFGPPVKAHGMIKQQILGKNSLLLEFSDSGTGDYRSPSVRASTDVSDITPFEYVSHRLVRGKPESEGCPGFLPGVRSESEDDCATVVLDLRDRVTGLGIELIYTVFPEYDVVVRKTVYFNFAGDGDIVLDKAMSCTNDFDGGAYTLTQLAGSWAREAQRVTHRVTPGIFTICSSRGTSSHMHNPVAIISKDTFGEHSETAGAHWGFALMYSGSFVIEVESSETGRLRVNAGLNSVNLKWKLKPGESLSSPEVVLAFSEAGVGTLSQRFHRIINERIIAPQWRYLRAPVVVNTWEAMYFEITRDRVVELGKYAASVGAEILCVDDGWFAGRTDDTSGLGDWVVDCSKIPLGLDNLAKEINSLGLKFGIWVEPEMVSPGSLLLERNPNCILFAPGRPVSMRRNQFILDFTQEFVRDKMVESIGSLLRSANIEYVKWDMNRHLTEPNSIETVKSGRLQGEVMHRHMLGVYQVLYRLTQDFPNVRFETCAGGGGRFDCGMLYFSPQIWVSDNTDAACRARIQTGLSLVYPVNCMSCHITESPNHQTGRYMPLSARSVVALFGAFGVELNLKSLTVDELSDLKTAIDKYKTIMTDMTQKRASLYRLWDPFDSQSSAIYGAEMFAWMLVSQDRNEAIIAAGMLRLTEVGKIIPKLQLIGIHPEKHYRVRDLLSTRRVRDAMTLKVVECPGEPMHRFKPLILPGRTLIHAGIPLQFIMDGDFILLQLSYVY